MRSMQGFGYPLVDNPSLSEGEQSHVLWEWLRGLFGTWGVTEGYSERSNVSWDLKDVKELGMGREK